MMTDSLTYLRGILQAQLCYQYFILLNNADHVSVLMDERVERLVSTFFGSGRMSQEL